MSKGPTNPIQRQIRLPISKAIEIAWKSIRLRLSRSLVVTSSIALAIAFLLSILAGEAFVKSLRKWKTDFESSAQFRQLVAERTEREESVREQARRLQAAVGDPGAPLDKPISIEVRFGKGLNQIKDELGTLPAGVAELSKALPQSAGAQEAFGAWLREARLLRAVRDQVAAPEVLSGKFQAAGVPTTAAEVEQARTQTWWVIGLALLVAFVGILNAMLMSVTERFREIGTMKCLGALDGFIVKLFLIESLFQGGAGTIAGVIIGLVLSIAAAVWSYGSFAWANVPWGELGIVALICFAVGVLLTVAGALYPAWQAARMQPIAAMRVEV
ncbi:MAG TPA: FtsX-like permease family protein [Tepidisphaeraceae bacterium]|nr:FtsX-like permease family protein [Tepidisphaeraceae bacterium]